MNQTENVLNYHQVFLCINTHM